MKILDSRNLEERLNELQSEFDSWKDSLSAEKLAEIKEEYDSEGETPSDEEFNWAWESEIGSDAMELRNLIELKDQFGREWFHGVELIREQDFEEYAEQYASDCGLISSKFQDWPYCHIDWNAAAKSLMMDYSSVDYDGETYYYRE